MAIIVSEEGFFRIYAAGIVKGYLRLAKSIGAVLTAILAVAGISLLIVTPLWFVATRYTSVYTTVSIIGLAAAVLTPLIVRLSKDAQKRKRFFLRGLRMLIYLGLAGFLYLIVLLYAWGNFPAAIPLTVVHAGLTGLILYGRRNKKK